MFPDEVAARLVRCPVRAHHWIDPVTDDVYSAPGFVHPLGDNAPVLAAENVDESDEVEDESGDGVVSDDGEYEVVTEADPKTGAKIEVVRRRPGRPRKATQ